MNAYTPDARYEIGLLIGPCSEAEAEALMYEIVDLPGAIVLGGAVRLGPWTEELSRDALLAGRQQDKERIELLEVLGNQAVSTIEFLHGCLTDPHEDGTQGGFTYCYPEQTERGLAELRRFLPSREICVHSKSVPGCQGCIDGEHAREVMGGARAALAGEEDAE